MSDTKIEYLSSDGEVDEGPGPPFGGSLEPTTKEEKIDQWVAGLRDDIDEIVGNIAVLQTDSHEEECAEEIEVEDWPVSKICTELKNGRFKNIVVLTGAGISTASGIPGTHNSYQLYHMIYI